MSIRQRACLSMLAPPKRHSDAGLIAGPRRLAKLDKVADMYERRRTKQTRGRATLSHCGRKTLPASELPAYIVAQVAGAIAGAGCFTG